MWVERTAYLNKLKDLKDRPLIKVMTGIRRSGKSVLLAQFQDWLRSRMFQTSRSSARRFSDAIQPGV